MDSYIGITILPRKKLNFYLINLFNQEEIDALFVEKYKENNRNK